jgi:hypothetical protein
MFGALGVKVTVVDQRERVLGFHDGEIVEAFRTACAGATSRSGCASGSPRSTRWDTIGTSATELVHIGQAVIAIGPGGLDFLVTVVFNYPPSPRPTKVAALDAANQIRTMTVDNDKWTLLSASVPLAEGVILAPEGGRGWLVRVVLGADRAPVGSSVEVA